MYTSIAATFTAWFGSAWIYLVFPSLPIFPTVLLPPCARDTPVVYIFVGVWYFRSVLVIWLVFLFLLSVALVFTFCFSPMITSDFRGDVTRPKCSPELREPSNFTRTYRTIEILLSLILENFGYILLPIQALVGQYGLVCNYVIIMQWDQMGVASKAFLISQMIMIQAAWVLCLTFGGWINFNSVKVLKSWKCLKLSGKEEAKYMSKFRKSCRPLYIGYPGVLKIRKVTALKYFQGVTRGTFRMLLAVKNA
ncbi:hypothetical protein Fcan01_10310 [Folsomia candida]|uniref:Uncharacterized protein n=1 Tax=Folsomia candida TaxID=158441 RepID=A0A226ED64_FOLCA|nr:hypothetical protein Fcan01_10310 [Folsomia candida]